MLVAGVFLDTRSTRLERHLRGYKKAFAQAIPAARNEPRSVSNGTKCPVGGACLSLEESHSMIGKYAESTGAVERTGAHSQEIYFFAGFTFSGEQDLEALAGFYGLSVAVLKPRITLAEYLARTCYGSPRPGYRIELGNVDLIVRQSEEGAITKVGLRLLPGVSRHRRRSPAGARYGIGASLVRTSCGPTLAAALSR
jgi:hypothetical protein